MRIIEILKRMFWAGSASMAVVIITTGFWYYTLTPIETFALWADLSFVIWVIAEIVTTVKRNFFKIICCGSQRNCIKSQHFVKHFQKGGKRK